MHKDKYFSATQKVDKQSWEKIFGKRDAPDKPGEPKVKKLTKIRVDRNNWTNRDDRWV